METYKEKVFTNHLIWPGSENIQKEKTKLISDFKFVSSSVTQMTIKGHLGLVTIYIEKLTMHNHSAKEMKNRRDIICIKDIPNSSFSSLRN